MNIHVIPNQKFTQMFCDLIVDNYPEDSNLIYVYRDGDFCLTQNKNIRYIESFYDIDLSQLDKRDKLFIHGFYNVDLIKFLYKNRKKFNRKQLVLIMWGADLYNNKLILMDGKLHLGIRCVEYLKKQVIKKSNIFMTFACADYDLAEKWYDAKGKQFDCLYPSNADIKLLNELKMQLVKEEPIRLLLGNSATQTNLHLEMLDILSKFKDQNIQIVCPLSYGDMEYGKNVQEYGKNIFEDKFIAITDYMAPEEYSKLLNSVQIAVFNHNRQQGTANIEILSYLGKKLYIRSDTTTWSHYVKRDGCKFFDALNIKNQTFDEFTAFSYEDKKINENYFKKIWDIDYVKSLWDKVMDY